MLGFPFPWPSVTCTTECIHQWVTLHGDGKEEKMGSVNQPVCPVQVVGGAWLFSRLYCNIFVTLDVMMCTASILNLCAISIDRWVLTSSVHWLCVTPADESPSPGCFEDCCWTETMFVTMFSLNCLFGSYGENRASFSHLNVLIQLFQGTCVKVCCGCALHIYITYLLSFLLVQQLIFNISTRSLYLQAWGIKSTVELVKVYSRPRGAEGSIYTACIRERVSGAAEEDECSHEIIWQLMSH